MLDRAFHWLFPTQVEPEDVRRVFGANAYATSHEGDVAIRPNRDAAAIERRDAAYARLHHEGLCATWIFCGWRFFQLTHRIRRRIAGAVVKRAVVEYRARRRDAFRQHFKRLVNYRAGKGCEIFPTSKAPISVVSHSFRLIFGRVIISWDGLEA